MLKIITLTYGTHGKSEEYSYITDRDVRNGQIVQPSVRHYMPPHKIFGTTGVVQHSEALTKQTGRAKLESLEGQGKVVQNIYTSKDAGVISERGQGGKFVNSGGLTTYKNADGKYVIGDNQQFQRTKNIEKVREYNVEQRKFQEGEGGSQYTPSNESKKEVENENL